MVAKEKEEYIQRYGNEFVSKAFDRQGPSKLTESESDGKMVICFKLFIFIFPLNQY